MVRFLFKLAALVYYMHKWIMILSSPFGCDKWVAIIVDYCFVGLIIIMYVVHVQRVVIFVFYILFSRKPLSARSITFCPG